MGMDFVALVQVDPDRPLGDAIAALERESPPEVRDLGHLLRSRTYHFRSPSKAVWIDETFNKQIRLREPPSLPDLERSLLLPEGFFITFGRDALRLYHTLRWVTFLTDSDFQAAMLDACAGLCRLFEPLECIVTSDHHPGDEAFLRGRLFDECLKVSDPRDGEVADLTNLYTEVETESDYALNERGRYVRLDWGKPLPLGWRRETVWESRGYWRLRWGEERVRRLGADQRRAFGRATAEPPPADEGHEAPPFLDALFPVCKKGRYGFIDTSGSLVIPLRFHDADAFVDGRARVGLGKSWGWVDTQGVVHEEAPVDRAFHGRWVEPRATETARLIPVYRTTKTAKGAVKTFGFADARELTLEIPAVFEDAGEFSEGLAPVRLEGRWGFIDATGTPVGSFSFAQACPHKNGRAAVCDSSGKWGYADANGNLVIGFQFDDASDFRPEGVARIEIRRRWGYIDLHGRRLWDPLES